MNNVRICHEDIARAGIYFLDNRQEEMYLEKVNEMFQRLTLNYPDEQAQKLKEGIIRKLKYKREALLRKDAGHSISVTEEGK